MKSIQTKPRNYYSCYRQDRDQEVVPKYIQKYNRISSDLPG